MKELPTDPFLRGYLMAALFTTNPDPQPGEFTADDAESLLPRVGEEFLTEAQADCADFQQSNQELLEEALDFGRSDGYTEERAGSDFWYSRNGHGVGFWDRGLEEFGDRLHAAAKVYGGQDLELGGWWVQEYHCQCGECWTRPEDADNDPAFGEDTCDACGKTVESLNRRQGEHLTAIDQPED